MESNREPGRVNISRQTYEEVKDFFNCEERGRIIAKNRGELEIEKFLAKKGDVLLWHARLMHRGSIPNDPDLWRETAILHYSGVNHRPDMPSPAIQHQQGGWYFPLNQNIPL